MIQKLLMQTQSVFERAKSEKTPKILTNPLLSIVIYLVTVLLATVGQFAIMLVFSIFMVIFFGDESFDRLLGGDFEILLMLFLCFVPIVISVIYCCGIERRSLRSMGFTKRHCLRDYTIGFAVALVMMGASVGIAYVGGALQYEGIVFNGQWGMLALFVIGWVIQGLSEEVCYRSYLMMSLGVGMNRFAAILLSSLIFAAAHLGNDGITAFSVVNLTLYGIFAALYFLRTDSIWGIAAMHSFWNCAQGNLFGQKVSGIVLDANIFSFTQKEGLNWLHGGSFGPEGGAAVTVVLLVGILVLFLMPQRKQEPAAA